MGGHLASPWRGLLLRLRLARFSLRIAPVHVWLAAGCFRFGLELKIWFGCPLRLGRSLVSSQLIGRLCHNGGAGRFHFGGLDYPARFSGCRVHGLGFQRSPLIAGLLNFLATLGKGLPFFPGHRLESHGTVFSFGQLVHGRCHQHAVLFGLRRVRIDISLGGPRARRPRGFVIAAILV